MDYFKYLPDDIILQILERNTNDFENKINEIEINFELIKEFFDSNFNLNYYDYDSDSNYSDISIDLDNI